MSINVQSVISAVPTVVKANDKGNTKTKTKALATTATAPNVPDIMTRKRAIDAAFEYGSSMAGIDGSLVKAIVAFKTDDTVLAEMLLALNVGYVMRKLDVDRTEAERIVGLLKYNESKQDDEHRTLEQQRVMDTVRVLWSRAKAMAGVPKAETQAKAEATRAAKEADRKAAESRLIRADELINPKDDVDPFDALARLVSTMKSLQKKYIDKLVGDRGSTWRDWLANAPK